MPDLNTGAFSPTDRVNHASAIANARRAMGSTSGIVSAGHAQPLFGLGEAVHEIMTASGLGRRTPEGKSPGEKMSDADGTKQDVKVTDDGGSVHRKATLDGVREVQIGRGPYDETMSRYPDLVHRHMPTSVAELQSNLGI